MNPTILGVIGPGFLNQVPTLRRNSPSRRVTSWRTKKTPMISRHGLGFQGSGVEGLGV